MIDWLAIMGRITLEEAKRQNWPAFTCTECFGPTKWNRGEIVCQSCFRDELMQGITITKQEPSCKTP